MSAALGLYRLQQVDSQIDQIQARLQAIQQMLENDAALRAAAERLAASEAKHRDAQQRLRQSEADVEKQTVKLQQAESSLYGGQVHHPKELQDLQKDVAALKRHLQTLEERELEAMLIAETAEKEWQDAQIELQRVKSGLGEQNRELTQESDHLRRELERLSAERQAIVKDIAREAMELYDQLRRQRRGIAVTFLSDGSCAACGTTLTASQQQSARSTSQLFRCPSCGRILYAD